MLGHEAEDGLNDFPAEVDDESRSLRRRDKHAGRNHAVRCVTEPHERLGAAEALRPYVVDRLVVHLDRVAGDGAVQDVLGVVENRKVAAAHELIRAEYDLIGVAQRRKTMAEVDNVLCGFKVIRALDEAGLDLHAEALLRHDRRAVLNHPLHHLRDFFRLLLRIFKNDIHGSRALKVDISSCGNARRGVVPEHVDPAMDQFVVAGVAEIVSELGRIGELRDNDLQLLPGLHEIAELRLISPPAAPLQRRIHVLLRAHHLQQNHQEAGRRREHLNKKNRPEELDDHRDEIQHIDGKNRDPFL